MRKVFATWFIFGIALSLQQSSFSLYLARTFGISSFVIGIIFGGIGVLILLNQLILLKRLWLKIGSTQKISQLMFIVFGVGMFFQSIPLMAALIIGLIGTTIGQGTIRALYGGIIANASEEKRGEYLGISSSLMSLSMVIGPLLATFFITDNPSIPIIMSGILGIFAFLINFEWKKQKKSN